MDTIQEFVVNFIQQRGMDLVWIIVLFFFGRVVLKLIVKRLVRIVDDKRAMTLGRIIVATGNVVIYVIILLMVLSLFGLDITPILAGAGVIGLAIGFGAQSLVKDFVSGLFILIENQYDMGDRVKIGTFEGRVVKITMRSTVLRDDEGKTFYISNGLINNVINLSQDNN
ncbi:mechanosensitive ion channel family protein [Patescibacteria group bacterium]|nr:mechanosensitive ion channel family protein [Patescibacteria group bacterium]